MLNFALCRSRVDAPLVGGAEFLQDPFGGEGDEDFLALSPGGKRPYWRSFPFERGCCCADISLVLLGHEDGVCRGERRCRLEKLILLLSTFSCY